MLGRTHGQAAVPITFGLKAAVWLDELRRQLIRLDEPLLVSLSVNSSAPLGGCSAGEHARRLASHFDPPRLGVLWPPPRWWTGPVVEYMSWLANIATSCEKILQEIQPQRSSWPKPEALA